MPTPFLWPQRRHLWRKKCSCRISGSPPCPEQQSLRVSQPAGGHKLCSHPAAETSRPPWVYGRRGSSTCHHLFLHSCPLPPAAPDGSCQREPASTAARQQCRGHKDLGFECQVRNPPFRLQSHVLREPSENHVWFIFDSMLKA